MNKTYRKGAIGALTDEYEKALEELKNILINIPDAEFRKVYNSKAGQRPTTRLQSLPRPIALTGQLNEARLPDISNYRVKHKRSSE